MSLIENLTRYNYYLSLPTAFILFALALWLTIILRGIQVRAVRQFFSLMAHGITQKKDVQSGTYINPIYALFTAMSTSIGMGTIVGPSVAILTGGPGALVWLILYAALGSVTKFTEVAFGVHFRMLKEDGSLVGGPMQYLSIVNPYLGTWYAAATIFLFSSWSAIQANVMAEILYTQGIPTVVTGFCLAFLIILMLFGGAQRIGAFSSKLVPIMFVLYVSVGLSIIYMHRINLYPTIILILKAVFSPMAPVGGFLGSSLMTAFCAGIYKGTFITESGMGTSAIPHALADVNKPTDQASLALASVFVDIFLCGLSGLLVMITGVWTTPCISNTLIYHVFQDNFPLIGKPILIISLSMFVIGTIIGNSFNGRQSFLSLIPARWLLVYYIFAGAMIMIGAVSNVPTVWAAIELILPLVAIPNAIGLIYLVKKYRKVLEL